MNTLMKISQGFFGIIFLMVSQTSMNAQNTIEQQTNGQFSKGKDIEAVWNISSFGCDFGHNNSFTLQRTGSPVCGSGNCPSQPAMPPEGCWGELITAIQYSGGGVSWTISANGSINLSHAQDVQVYGDTWIFSDNAVTINPSVQSDVGHVWINNVSLSNPNNPISLVPGWNHLEFTSYNQNQGTVFNVNYDFTSQNLILAAKVTLDIKAFLEGPFVEGEMTTDLNLNNSLLLKQPYSVSPWFYEGQDSVSSIPNSDIVDWVLVELRETDGDVSTATSSTIVSRQAAFLFRNGQISDLDGNSLLDFYISPIDNLFVVIYHLNHLPIISSQALTMNDQRVYEYNFTESENSAFGGNLAQKELEPGVWGMFAGDGNADGEVSQNDKDATWTPFSGFMGYFRGDFNLSSNVNNVDKNDFWLPNNGQGSQVPY
ncbi:MAG: hypothetical protein R2764_08365 [Bacteroidales bacterium]